MSRSMEVVNRQRSNNVTVVKWETYPEQRGACLWQFDGGDVDEVERFPLR